MPDPALLDRLRHAVTAGFARQTAFLSDLVRFPSVRGGEGPLQDWLARQLATAATAWTATRWRRWTWRVCPASAP